MTTYAPSAERRAALAGLDTLDFELPVALEADAPAEERGHGRDDVRLMVSHRADNRVEHTSFCDLPAFFQPGDVLVINTSATLPAALMVARTNGALLELHLSTHLPNGRWTVEARQLSSSGTTPFFDLCAGERLVLPGGGQAIIEAAYSPLPPTRLWLARLELPLPVHAYLQRFGFPIRYNYAREAWPISAYQTVYATEPGSAEMPSAGRAFTNELLTRLVAQGTLIVPLVLHTGVASLEQHEPPYAEFFRIPETTARIINLAHQNSNRVIAVGTTVVRALETAATPNGQVVPGEGWTELVITPERGIHTVDGLLTGLHEPRASHLAMLEALAGREHLAITYAAALHEGYLWHEFGDLHLLLP